MSNASISPAPEAPQCLAEPEMGGNSPYPVECDLIMKGGITSGIVYPLAVLEIHKAFRLRSIGGTSAGAIAAGAAAAAELGRQRRIQGLIDADHRDFDALADLPGYLGAPAESGVSTRLLSLFRPHPKLATLFNGLTSTLNLPGKGAKFRAIGLSLLGFFKVPMALGFALGALPLLLGSAGWLAGFWLMLFGALCGVLLSAVALFRLLVRVLPENGFGICNGMPAAGDKAPNECLTVWLHDYFNQLSGQQKVFGSDADPVSQHKPLTFGDLKCVSIDLQMMTTCLSHARPYRLPFRDEVNVRDNKQFYYKEAEFRQLFPAAVVDWMVAHERPSRHANDQHNAGYRRLPEPDDLPVVVAARMSLSFPILLSAIPLYARDYQLPDPVLERCWFSDGGLSSNFPIHFFDSPLPQRPTFGIDLGKTEQADSRRVVFPNRNNDAWQPSWRRFENGGGLGAISGFLSTVINTSKEWNHDTLSRMPGFRDRIGLIRLTAEEGGLNLAMPPERIRDLTEYGREAGIEFVKRFGDSQKYLKIAPNTCMNWENHQLIRLRLLVASMSEMLAGLKTSHDRLAQNSNQRYTRFFSTADLGPAAYRFQGRGVFLPRTSQAALSEHILETLLDLAEDIHVARSGPRGASIDPANKAPKPTPEFKLRPRI